MFGKGVHGEEGEVTALHGNRATVRIQAGKGCGRCRLCTPISDTEMIVDISIDQGGCIETSECRDHKNPIIMKHGIIHYAVSNIPARVARTASIALSNVFAPILLQIGDSGGLQTHFREDPGLRKGVYIYNGILTNRFVGRKFGIMSKDIELLLAAF